MRAFVIGVLLVTLAGCGSNGGAEQPREPQTQRQRDSAIAESGLPGAGGVRGALDAADSAAARRARADSIARER